MSSMLARPVAAEVLETSGWVQAHDAVLRVARERAALERREGVCLLRARRDHVHRHLGYGAFAEYTDRYLGYCSRTTADKLRTAEALEALPALAQAQRDGRLTPSAVRELARVATAETEAAWMKAASGLRVREVERLVSGRARGDRPTDTPRPSLIRHVLRFEVSPETLAAFRDAMRHVSEQTGQHLDDDALLLLIARGILEPAASPPASGAAEHTHAGRPRYQISVTECPRCKRASMPAGADRVEIDAAMLATAHCDAHVVEMPRAHAAPDTTHGGAGADAPLQIRENAAPTAPAPRATPTITPALRRRVVQRDHRACQLPGCRNTLGIEVHHIRPRADGGPNHADNLVCLCSVHHRAIHAGQLHLSGSANALRVCHADGSSYGAAVCAARSDTSEKVFRGLRWLGFRERDARAAVQAALRDPATHADLQHDESELLRQALAHLG